jgi:hypothetical protein
MAVKRNAGGFFLNSGETVQLPGVKTVELVIES